MTSMWILMIAVILMLISSTVISAPNSLGGVFRVNVSGDGAQDVEGNQNGLSAPPAVNADASDGSRTLIMFGMLQWLLGIVKAVVRPAKNMYAAMKPEITAFKCLSGSRELQNLIGFSRSDFEDYADETPRTSDTTVPLETSSREQNPNYNDPRFLNEMHDSEHHQNILPEPGNSPEKFYSTQENSISQTTRHPEDEVLKRIPRFIDEFASLLKEGQAMNCIMPYMRERVTRWIDS